MRIILEVEESEFGTWIDRQAMDSRHMMRWVVEKWLARIYEPENHFFFPDPVDSRCEVLINSWPCVIPHWMHELVHSSITLGEYEAIRAAHKSTSRAILSPQLTINNMDGRYSISGHVTTTVDGQPTTEYVTVWLPDDAFDYYPKIREYLRIKD